MNSFEEEYMEQMSGLVNTSETTYCSQAENKEIVAKIKNGEDIPSGYQRTMHNSNTFYKIAEHPYTIEQMEKLLHVQQVKYIHTIKNTFIVIAIMLGIIVFGLFSITLY